jgi:hypothetical protein
MAAGLTIVRLALDAQVRKHRLGSFPCGQTTAWQRCRAQAELRT